MTLPPKTEDIERDGHLLWLARDRKRYKGRALDYTGFTPDQLEDHEDWFARESHPHYRRACINRAKALEQGRSS